MAPGLHAWAEYRDGGGRWSVADASTADGPEPLLLADLREDSMPTEVATLAIGAPMGAAGTQPASRLPVALLALLAAAGAVALVLRRSPARVDLDPEGDLAALLGGALRHPASFSALPAMSHGRFVPLVGDRGAISLDQARRLADRRRLFRSDAGYPLALAAAARGVPVIDGGSEEGRVLSQALGAVDVDGWSKLLERTTESGQGSGRLGWRIHRRLEDLGEPWRVRLLSGLDQPVVEIALENLKLGRRLVLVDLDHPD